GAPMNAPVGAHPSADTLRAFSLGNLDEALARSVMEHLGQCPACGKVVAAQSGDDFLARLRAAHGAGTTPAPAQLPAPARPAESTPLPPRTAAAAPAPPELAGHPQYDVVRELGRGGM